MLEDLRLPGGLELIRTTEEFTAASIPKALLHSHHIAAGHWGVLRVLDGRLDFVVETTGERRTVGVGEAQVIEPDVSHHVEPAADARFVIEFHR